MKLLLVCGFDGSDKSEFIDKSVTCCKEKKIKLAIIENKVNLVSDEQTTETTDEPVIKNLGGGCVCCQMASSLIITMCEIDEYVNPDWCLLELPAIAEVGNILNTLRAYYRADLQIHIITVVNLKRWDTIQKMTYPNITNQLSQSEMIYLTDCPVGTEILNYDKNYRIEAEIGAVWENLI